MRTFWLSAFLLTACTDEEEVAKAPADESGTTGATTGDTGSTDDSGDTDTDTPAPPTYSQGTCPTLEAGVNTGFAHAHGSHDVRIVLPDDPTGAPVLFAWHWLGGSSADIVRYMDLEGLAEREGVIVLAPDSAGSAYEWEFVSPAEDNPDLALFVDLLACAHDQWGVDMSRIWTTGMSAGGLWTTFLTMHESEWLAASAPLSGGTFPGSYATPTDTLPVMVTWGGPDDTYGSDVNFQDLSLDFSGNLQADGHFVVECVHDRGHDLPPDATNLVWTFLSAHVKGEPSPWADGLPSSMPDMCTIP